jgi:RNA polymerase sigma-70 factor (ECF subfamily)
MNSDWNTRYSLLRRAADQSDEDAWNEFLRYYDRFIYYLLNRMTLKPEDMKDLRQVILIRLWENLKTYQRTDKKFRSWLALIVRNIAYDYFRSEKRRRKLFSEDVEIDQVDVSTLATSIEQAIEREWEAYIVNFAMNRLRSLFSENAIKVFELSLDGHTAAEIADKLNIGVDSVYTLKNRVRARLIKEVHAVMNEVERP